MPAQVYLDQLIDKKRFPQSIITPPRLTRKKMNKGKIFIELMKEITSFTIS